MWHVKNFINLKASDSIKEAAIVLTNKGIEGAPVVDNEKIVGILTLSDIIRAIAEDNEDLFVKDIMSEHIITVEKDVMIADAIELMYKNKIGRLIVVEPDNSPLGIITRTDLLDQIARLK